MVDLKQYHLDGIGISAIEYDNEEHWLELRKKGIGGSDAAAVLGLHKSVSPLMCYNTKKDIVDANAEDLSDNVFIKKGKDLEPLIRDKYVTPYMLDKGYRVEHPEVMFVNREHSWLRANLDGIAIPLDERKTSASDNIVIEIKWVSEYGEANWNGEEYCGIPANYYAQVQHYMLVVGANKAIVCALFDSDWTMHYFEIPFDLTFAVTLLKETYSFYNNHLLRDVPPPAIPSLDKQTFSDVILRVSATPKFENPDIDEECEEYLRLKDQCKQLESRMSEVQDSILSKYAEGQIPTKRFSVSVKRLARTSLNTTFLKENFSEAYAESLTESYYTRSTIKKAK